jgi:imidazolonepropionase-like amidohydrolase
MRILLTILICLITPFAGQAQSPVTAFTNGNIIDVIKGKTLSNYTVLVQDNKIIKTGPAAKVAIPTGAKIVDATGLYIMPGMVDAHIHLFQSGGLYTRPDAINLEKNVPYQKERQWLKDNSGDLLRRYLTCGITTVFDVGGPMYNYTIRDSFNAKPSVSPVIYLTGSLVSTYVPGPFEKINDAPIRKAATPEAARKMVQEQLPFRPDFIKIWYIVLPGQKATDNLPVIQATIDESHKNKLRVAVHATELETARLAVEAGADILVHSVEDTLADPTFIALLRKKNIVYIPTLIVADKYSQAFSQQYKPTYEDFTKANPYQLGTLFDGPTLSQKKLLDGYKAYVNGNRARAAAEDSFRLVNLKRVIDAGVTVVAGTDAGNIGTQHGSSYFQEVAAMKQSGISNIQVLQSLTINGAKALGKEKLTGSVEEGKLADLLLLSKNPLEDINNIKYLNLLVRNGQLIKTDTLIKETPEALAMRQLNAYNAHDIEGFLEPYSDSVEIYNFPGGQPFMKGKTAMREGYAGFFKQVPNLHCQVTSRMVLGNTVIDKEYITGLPGGKPAEGIAIYKIENNKIVKVYFIQ